MFKLIEKYWLPISIFLILATLASALFWPGAAQGLAIGVLLVTVGMVIAFGVRARVRAYRAGRFDKVSLATWIALDVLEVLVTLGIALMAGRAAGNAAAQAAAGMGAAIETLAGLAAGIAVGLAAGFIVRWAWGKAARPKPAS